MQNSLTKKQLINSAYEVQFFIGGDDYAEKYRVKKDGKTYLLKLYNSSKLSSNSFSNGNLLEVEILASLNIDNIVKLVDNGEFVKDNNKYHFIVFAFVSGESIKDKMQREGTFSQYVAVPIVIYLLETLQDLHNRQTAIIHNNINISSVFLDMSGGAEMPILSDFGFAKYITSKSNSVDTSRLNPFYMASELFNGIFTPQSDIFSVGALLYQMIMGIPPWYVEIPPYQHTKEKFTNAVLEKRNEPLNWGLKGFDEFNDEHLKAVINKALAVNVDDRFKTADEFISALKGEMVIADTQTKAVPPQAVKKKGEGFAAIAGMQNLKDILYNDVIRALNEKELYESYGITIPNGMLLYGPPGCGKTFISEHFAEEVGFNYLELKPSDIKSKFVNETEEKIGAIFKQATEKAPSIIFIDEIDAVVPSRESNNLNHMNASAVNEFLAQMSNCSEKGIFVIAASNRPEKIDPAILRTGRIDRIIYLSPPDYEARVSMFKLYLKKRPTDLGLNYERLAELTENYVSSDIKFLVDEASRFALKQRARITNEIFDIIFANTKPSVSYSEIKKYEALKDILENNKTKKEDEPRRPVGFR